MKPIHFVALCATVAVPVAVLASDVPMAGLDPSKRPAGAPVLSSLERSGAWYRQALTGISEPYPGSLRFLERQGRWHTPFNQPGMTGPYDIRGWHRQPPAEQTR